MRSLTNLRKTTYLLLFAVFLLLVDAAHAALPQNYHAFKTRYAREAKSPEGAVKLHFDAIFCYMDPATREEGSKMLRYSLRLRKDWEKNDVWRTFVERMEDPEQRYIFRSYAVGATPANNYRMSLENYKLDIVKKWAHPSGDLQVSLKNAGADSPRVIYLRSYDKLWFVSNNASVYAQVRPPKIQLDKTGHDADYDDVNYGSSKKIDRGEEKVERYIVSGDEVYVLKEDGEEGDETSPKEKRKDDAIGDKLEKLLLELLLKRM